MTQQNALERACDRLSDEETIKIERIAARAAEERGYHRLSIFMAVTVVHAEYGLDLDGLLAADEVFFHHDIAGINGHLDRERGVLEPGFRPRYMRGAAEDCAA